ncbi:hypothetical protein Clacol_004652 [Clathrus columnatus]|uniref:Nucleolar protein 10 n=1 Tax=Clathrus columnatus TaxID=1419009 RepID=A0AAV5A721_9AGAM|nr:hypothetical protein Clacol_004652 [Clathrus columnatus]
MEVIIEQGSGSNKSKGKARASGQSHKERYLGLQKKFDELAAKQKKNKAVLDIASSKLKSLQAECEMLIDSIAPHVSTQPSLLHFLERMSREGANKDKASIYTVNGAATGSATSLPDWLTRKRAAKAKGKRAIREHVEGTIDLIQHFEFAEASNRIRTTRDGHHAVATGVYKPQMRVWDLDQLTLKFERHSDAENVDFLILSDDWTKTVHLQTDRTIELHNQSGFYYRTRIPHFGRNLGFHFPTCDLVIAASTHEVYRLNLDQGRFMIPLDMSSGGIEDIEGVNVVNINPAHQLFAFGIDGNGTVQFWDPRSRSRVGILTLPTSGLLPASAGETDTVSATAIASRSDGLSYAIGTSTGHTLLYDIRSRRPFTMKDQGYGLPVKCLEWVEGGSRIAGDGMVISADKKVVKIWDRNSAHINFASMTPSTDINHLHHIPGSGLIMLANEGIQMNAYYIPQLGPAPKWCSFLDNITEEMEDQTGRSVYEDYKFVERSELAKLGLDHLVGTPALKPYMHGYFLSLKLYDAARVISNPYIHEEHREKMVKEKLEKLSETRIRTRKDAPKVNKILAEKIRREEERELKREEKRRRQKGKDVAVDQEDAAEPTEQQQQPQPTSSTLLTDERFKALFEDPEFEVDTNTREYSLLNPSTSDLKRRRTAVEEEEDESDRVSSDDDMNNSESKSGSEEEDSELDDGSTDSSDAGSLHQFNPRAREPTNGKAMRRTTNRPAPKLVPLLPQTTTTTSSSSNNKDVSFGERRWRNQSSVPVKSRDEANSHHVTDGVMEMTWVPSPTAQHDDDDDDGDGGASNHVYGGKAKKTKIKEVERFGAGMEKGRLPEEMNLDHANRFGRTKRRTGIRSGSRNVFRKLA